MAWALECDGVNDYLSTNISNDDDVLRISAKIKFDAGTIGGDNRLVAFDPSGVCFIGFGVYQGKLRIYSRDINSNAVAVLSSNKVDTGEFIDVYWELNKVTGMVTVSENGTKSSATNANSTNYPLTLTSSTLMSQSAASGRLKAQVSTISMIDTTTSSNSFFLDATASDHSNTGAQPVLVDTIGNNNATGVNFPTDGSAWVNSGGGTPTESYNFSATISQQTQFTSAKCKTVNVNALLAKNYEIQALTTKSINYTANINQLAKLSSAANKSANVNSVIAQNYQNQATANKQNNATGAITQTVLLMGYFNNSTIETHQFSANITINPNISAALTKQNALGGDVKQTQALAATATKTATLQSNCFYQVKLSGQSTKQTNISGLINQTVQLNALFINTAAPIHLRLFRIDGQIAFQRFNGAIAKQRFNGAIAKQRFNGALH